MNAMDELKNEHRAIECALDILSALAGRIHEPQAVEDAERLLDFFRTFADKCHHGKEEALLFPALEQSGITRQGGPIGVMLAEHDVGRGHIREMAQAIVMLKQGANQPAAEIFGQHARAYVAMLKQHIFKEDNVLFVMAENRLSAAQKQSLLREFERVEKEIIGEGRHETYHQLLENLTNLYIG
jgi:hemerythrin-like domain-containing protein